MQEVVKNLPKPIVVLGNHDLHLLTIFNQLDPIQIRHTFDAILQAPDCNELIAWLRNQPLLYHDELNNYVMTHAGIYPSWTLEQAKICAKQAEQILQSENYVELLEHMYGNEPNMWHENLADIEKFRFSINCFTRMRFCNAQGQLDLVANAGPDSAPPGFVPWFQVPKRKTMQYRIIFGHWAALEGKTNIENVYALDTGCVWGGGLTAMRLEDNYMFRVKCKPNPKGA